MSSCARSAEQILVVFRQFTDSKVSPLAEGSPPSQRTPRIDTAA